MRGSRNWNHNVHYHDFIRRSLPPHSARMLDIGCGEGLLAQKLAGRCEEVMAIDIDHATLNGARERGREQPHVVYLEADAMTYPFPEESFDAITAVATLHHLPLEAALIRLRSLLKPGGTLVVVGLYRSAVPADYVFAVAGLLASRAMRCVFGWNEIEAPMTYPAETLGRIREACRVLLPGAVVRRRLFFRYSLVWRKAARAV
jgi:ubiquinone/menaquinone biosynthesis C-methylase UbiE